MICKEDILLYIIGLVLGLDLVFIYEYLLFKGKKVFQFFRGAEVFSYAYAL
jgi:hypothetical protein